MEEAPHPKGKLSDLVRGDLLPPPPIGRATVAGTGAAMMGAAAWGLIAYYGNVEVGYLAIGIGALIGWVMVKAGGHGTPIAVCAALLTLLSILSGKYVAFRMDTGWMSEELHAAYVVDARDWQALEERDDASVAAFLRAHEYTIDVPMFREYFVPRLEFFATQQPDLEAWRAYEMDVARFVSALRENVDLYDLLFAVIGIAAAASMVSRHTTDLQARASQQLREKRRVEAEAAEPKAE